MAAAASAEAAAPPPPPLRAATTATTLLHPPLARAVAAACCCSLATGWLIGMWGGVTASPTFAARFFPPQQQQHGASANSTHGSTSHGASGYCMYNDQLLSFSGSAIYVSAVAAAAVAAHATHRYGRCATMAATAALLIAGAAVGAAAAHLSMVFVSRLLLGAAMGCSFQAPTILLAEALPRQRRGAGLYAYNTAMLVGFLLSAAANLALHRVPFGWRLMSALLAVPGLLVALILLRVPETPQFLLQRGDEAAAVDALRRLRVANADISEELRQMKTAVDRSIAGKRAAAATAAADEEAADEAAESEAAAAKQGWRQQLLPACCGGGGSRSQSSSSPSLCSRENRAAAVASALYPLVLMLSGLNVLSTWAPNLLLALGAAPAWALGGNAIMMAVGLAAALPSVALVERAGRRKLLAAGGAVVAASMLALGALLGAYLPGNDSDGNGGEAKAAPPPAHVLPLALLLLCVNRAALSCTLQPLAATVPAEVQPLAARSRLSGLTAGMRNASSFFVVQFTLPLLCATRWVLFLIIGSATLAGVVALWALVPETRGVPLEEMHLVYEGHWLWGRQHRHEQHEQQQQHGSGSKDPNNNSKKSGVDVILG